MNKENTFKKQNFFSKRFGLMIAILIILLGVVNPIFFSRKTVSAETQKKVIVKDIPYQINGSFSIVSANNTGLCFDVQNGLQLKDSVPILLYNRHTEANQKFTFTAVEATKTSYVYSINPIYTNRYVLDISANSQESGTKLQIYSSNGTNAQKFIIKEIYKLVNGEYKYVGYVIFTGATNYTKVLAHTGDYRVVQDDFNTNSINLNQVWYFDKTFSGYSYNNSGYNDDNKVVGVYNAINYGLSTHYNSGYYQNTGFWSRYEDFLTVQNSSNWDSKNARFTEYGYSFFDSAQLNVLIDNALSEVYAQTIFTKHWISVAYDGSMVINGSRYTDNSVGRGCVEVEYIDDNNKSFSVFTTNVFNQSEDHLVFKNKENSQTFTKVGRYVVRVYYKVEAQLTTYVMKELQFAIVSSSASCDAVKATTDDKTLSCYKLSVNKNNDIVVKYDGNPEYKANDNELIEYLTNSYYLDTKEKQESVDKLKKAIKTFNEYKVYFTNTSFFLSSGGNKFVQIGETKSGYNDATTEYSYSKTKNFVLDGIYEFVTQNDYVYGVHNYYKVLLQAEPNKQVFRNVTYCYQDEDKNTINYAMDYAFLEDLKIFPYTMTLKITYQNITGENENAPIEYKSNSIIYNTTNDILKLKFVVKDISGNKTELYLYIYPSFRPTLNLKNLTNESYRYNYYASGYSIKLYDDTTKSYKNNLFSSKSVAFENFISSVMTTPDICTNQNGIYTLKYNPNGENTSINFNSNEELVEYLYDIFDNYVDFDTVLPQDFNNYVISEKCMHFDTLYLNKDFYFTTDNNFPLFESYKTFFEYYDENGKLLKQGMISYNGDYKYGESMFKILADENEANWKTGYVKFLEYNISPNKGNEYTAYIVNGNPSINLRYNSGTRYSKKSFNQSTNIDCEEFIINERPSQDTIYIVESENAKKVIDYNSFEIIKFKKSGLYTITVYNTHGFNYQIKLNVQGLSSNIEGVENQGTTSNSVIFKSKDLNFRYYINGKLQDNSKFTLNEGGEYVYTFVRTNVDQNIFIEKDTLQFAFILKGDTEFDSTPYYSYENNYMTPSMVRQYKFQIKNKIENLESKIKQLQSMLSSYNKDYIANFEKQDLQNKQYDTYMLAIKDIQLLIAENDDYIEEMISSNNILLKQNDKYQEIFSFKKMNDELKLVYKEIFADYKNYAINYFNAKNISLPNLDIEILLGKTESEIDSLYAEYTQMLPSYQDVEYELSLIKKQVKDILNSNTKFSQQINFISLNYKGLTKLSKLYKTIQDMNDFENSYIYNLIELRNKSNTISFERTTNPFLNDYISSSIITEQVRINTLIELGSDGLEFDEIYAQLKQMIYDQVNTLIKQDSSQINSMEYDLQTKIDFASKVRGKNWLESYINQIVYQCKLKDLESEIEALKLKDEGLLNGYLSKYTYIYNMVQAIQNMTSNVIEEETITKIQTLLEQIQKFIKKLS